MEFEFALWLCWLCTACLLIYLFVCGDETHPRPDAFENWLRLWRIAWKVLWDEIKQPPEVERCHKNEK